MTEPGQQPLSRREARESHQPEGKSGIAAVIARHPRIWMASAGAVAFLTLATGAFALGVANAKPATAQSPTGEIVEIPERAVPVDAAAATRLRTCSVAALTEDPALKSLRAAVVDSTSGDVLLDIEGSKPARTASVLKVLTAAAALIKLGPDYRLATRVFEGSQPGSIVLVGGGDPTLTRLTTGESVYTGAPRLSDLASQAVAAYADANPDTPITSIVVDASYWNADDNWVESWSRDDQVNGYQSEVTALQVDGDRADPTQQVSSRGTDPVGRAGKAFAEAVASASGQPLATVTTGTVTSTTKLAEVTSQPVSALVHKMLISSDGSIAENLARVISVEMGLGGGSKSVGQAIAGAIGTLGLDTSDLTIIDGSGLSKKNAIPALFMAEIMGLVREGTAPLNHVYNSLSVAGETGGLRSRFLTSDAKGKVVAKTGHIGSATTLSGIIEAADGTVLSFAFYAVGEGITPDAVGAIDALVDGVYQCGDNLAFS